MRLGEDDIVAFVEAVSPQTVIPVHTFEPDAFAAYFDNVATVSDGRAFTL